MTEAQARAEAHAQGRAEAQGHARVEARAEVRLEPWTADDLPVLLRNDAPEMTRYLGGPEGEEKVISRHAKFLREQGTVTWPFTIRSSLAAEPVGSVVYWQSRHHEADVYEIGWAVAPEHQGHGYATTGSRLALEHAADQGDRTLVWAFPRIDNPASNALARAAGFTNTGEEDFEYPKGVPIIVNAWVFDLEPLRHRAP